MSNRTTTSTIVLAATAAIVGGMLVGPAAHAVETNVTDSKPTMSVVDQRTSADQSAGEPNEAASPWLLDGKDNTGPKDYPNAPGAKKQDLGSKQAPSSLPRVAG